MANQYIFHNELAAPMPYGLANTGSICYWNSLMQCLMSCTSIAEAMKYVPIKSPIVLAYLKLVFEQNPGQSSVVLNELVKLLRRKNKNLAFGNQQESSSEGLVLFIDELPGRVQDQFIHRYSRYIICGHCGFKTEAVKGTSVHFECFEPAFETFTTAKQFCDQILEKTEPISDYKCDCCGQRNPKSQRVEKLTMAPEIIIILFNKYYQKKMIYCPDTIELPGTESILKYIQVGQARHGGSLHGGHYWANIRRQNRFYVANDISISAGDLTNSAETYMVFFERVR